MNINEQAANSFATLNITFSLERRTVPPLIEILIKWALVWVGLQPAKYIFTTKISPWIKTHSKKKGFKKSFFTLTREKNK